MAKSGSEWAAVPRRLIDTDAYLEFAVPVSPGALLDRLYIFACDRYGTFHASLSLIRRDTGLAGTAAEFDDALDRLESAGFVMTWPDEHGFRVGILTKYNPTTGGIPSAVFRGRPPLNPRRSPPERVAAVCGWVPPASRPVPTSAARLAVAVQAHGTACLHCGTDDGLVADHIVPIARGGADSAENLQPLCVACNAKKGAKSDADARLNLECN